MRWSEAATMGRGLLYLKEFSFILIKDRPLLRRRPCAQRLPRLPRARIVNRSPRYPLGARGFRGTPWGHPRRTFERNIVQKNSKKMRQLSTDCAQLSWTSRIGASVSVFACVRACWKMFGLCIVYCFCCEQRHRCIPSSDTRTRCRRRYDVWYLVCGSRMRGLGQHRRAWQQADQCSQVIDQVSGEDGSDKLIDYLDLME